MSERQHQQQQAACMAHSLPLCGWRSSLPEGGIGTDGALDRMLRLAGLAQGAAEKRGLAHGGWRRAAASYSLSHGGQGWAAGAAGASAEQEDEAGKGNADDGFGALAPPLLPPCERVQPLGTVPPGYHRSQY